mgnify:CR=1 FL=1
MKKRLGFGSESNTPRDGVLSSRAEWSALLIGCTVGVITAIAGGKDAAWLFIILATIAFGGKKVNVGQLQHISDEPLYALVGAVMSFLLTALAVIPHLTNGIV